MNFFCTKKEYDEWTSEMKLDQSNIFCLNVEEAIQVAKMLFNVVEI